WRRWLLARLLRRIPREGRGKSPRGEFPVSSAFRLRESRYPEARLGHRVALPGLLAIGEGPEIADAGFLAAEGPDEASKILLFLLSRILRDLARGQPRRHEIPIQGHGRQGRAAELAQRLQHRRLGRRRIRQDMLLPEPRPVLDKCRAELGVL